jgi:hypothetical protein
MARYLPSDDQRWHSIDVRGITMQACRLWEGNYNVESALYQMPKGMTIPSHHHAHWCQVFVVSGTMEVQADAEEQHIITAGAITLWSLETPTEKPLSKTACCW